MRIFPSARNGASRSPLSAEALPVEAQRRCFCAPPGATICARASGPLFQHDVRFRVRGTKPTRAQKEIRSLLGDCEQAMKKVLAGTNLGELVDQLNK